MLLLGDEKSIKNRALDAQGPLSALQVVAEVTISAAEGPRAARVGSRS